MGRREVEKKRGADLHPVVAVVEVVVPVPEAGQGHRHQVHQVVVPVVEAALEAVPQDQEVVILADLLGVEKEPKQKEKHQSHQRDVKEVQLPNPQSYTLEG